MAAKMKMLKLVQEIRGLAELTNRRPQPKPLGLFLVQMRSHITQTSTQNRKRNIAIEGPAPTDIPHPVKITHLRSQAARSQQLVTR